MCRTRERRLIMKQAEWMDQLVFDLIAQYQAEVLPSGLLRLELTMARPGAVCRFLGGNLAGARLAGASDQKPHVGLARTQLPTALAGVGQAHAMAPVARAGRRLSGHRWLLADRPRCGL